MKILRILTFVGCVALCQSAAWGQHTVAHDVIGSGGGRSDGGGVFLNGTIGQPVIGPSSGTGSAQYGGYWNVVDRLHVGPTSAVQIAAFTAAVVEGGVRLQWVIARADELRGFNVYRSDEPAGPFTRINGQLIPADRGNTYRDTQVKPAADYCYQIGAVDADGEYLSPPVRVSIPPGQTTLYQNYPNPFNPVTTISFYLPAPERVVLTIYNARGERVRKLFDGFQDFGRVELPWNGRNDAGDAVGSGVYFYRLRAGKTVLTRKLTLLK